MRWPTCGLPSPLMRPAWSTTRTSATSSHTERRRRSKVHLSQVNLLPLYVISHNNIPPHFSNSVASSPALSPPLPPLTPLTAKDLSPSWRIRVSRGGGRGGVGVRAIDMGTNIRLFLLYQIICIK